MNTRPTMKKENLELSLSDFFEEKPKKQTQKKKRKSKIPDRPCDIQPVSDIQKEVSLTAPSYNEPLYRDRSYYHKNTEEFRVKQQSMIIEKQKSKNEKYKDHRLDPFYLIEHIESITYEIVPYIAENQRKMPIEVDPKTGYLANPRSILEYIFKNPLRSSFCFVHHAHDPLPIYGKERDANTRILYCRVFQTMEEYGWVWVSKIVGVPYGWVFLDVENGEEELIRYLSKCIPIQAEPMK